MPYKKHHRKSHSVGAKKQDRSRHSHRMGAVALNVKSPTMKIGLAAASYFLLATPLNSLIDTSTGGAGKIDPKILGLIEAGGGYALAFRRGSGTLGVVLGAVLLGAGAKRLLQSFGVVSGYGSIPVIGSYQKVPVIAGYNPSMNALGYTTQKNNTAIVGGLGDGGLLDNEHR